MQKKRRQSVLKNYLVTYVGLAVAVCAVLGVVLMMVSSNNLRGQEEASVTERLSSACDDFAYQLDVLNDLKIQIYTSPLYQPFNLKKNEINRMEMLEHFENLTSNSVITGEYYLIYEENEIIYTANGAASPGIFCRFLAPGITEEQFWSALRGENNWIVFDTDSGRQIYRRLPIVFNRYSQNTRAFILFRIDQKELARRYEALFRFSGEIVLEVDGVRLLGEGQEMPALLCRQEYHGEEMIIGTQLSGAPAAIYSMLYILIICMLGFSAISAYLAYRNYSPIRALVSKTQDHAPAAGDEIERIAQAVDHVIELNTATMAQLSESLENASRMKESLKQQLLLLVLSGEYDASMNQRMAELGMDVAGKVLCVSHITYDKAVAEDALRSSIDALSDSDTRLHLARLGGERGWALLMIARDEENLLAALDTVNEALGQRFPAVHLTQGEICTQVQKLAYSLAVAESNQNRDPDSPMEHAKMYDLLNELKKCLSEGNEIPALSALEHLMDCMDRDYPSLMFRRYRLVDVAYQIMECARSTGCPLEEEQMRGAISSQDSESIRGTLEEAVRKICAASPKAAVQIPPASRQVMDYIEAHATDYDICLDAVATACDISTKQVSRIARNVVGMGFKEYVSHLRMRKAMALLKAGLSATDTARQVGYSDISHFTKVFRGHTGITPGQYRMQMGQGGEDGEGAGDNYAGGDF